MDSDNDERDAARRREYEEAVCRTRERMTTSKKGQVDNIRAILATPEAFEKWLLRHHPTDIVGDIVNIDESSTANFVWDELGVYLASALNPIYYFDDAELVTFDPPAWYKAFQILEYREIHRRPGPKRDIRVSAGEELRILHQSLREDKREV